MKRVFETTEQRSNIMKKIKGKDTKIELKLRKALWHLGLRYRKNYKELPGKPDNVTEKCILFLDSNNKALSAMLIFGEIRCNFFTMH